MSKITPCGGGALPHPLVEQSPFPTGGNIVGAYKSITTKLANKEDGLPGRIIWQRNYYDHIIRDEKEWVLIRKYIENKPCKGQEDKYYRA